MLTLEMAIQKIQHFSPEQRNKVIEFIEFLEFQASQTKTIEQKNDDSDREPSFFDLAGIWERKNITLDDIRKDAWGKEVAKHAYRVYESRIRQKVETEENIGKMVIINIETGDYEVDETGLQAAKSLQAKSPYARLFGIRIGYNVAASFGGVMERVSSDFRYCD